MHDSHVHLNLKPLSNNLSEVINTFTSQGGKHILTQSTDLIDVEETLSISEEFSEIVDTALGLHPTCFEENTILKGKKENIYEFSQKYITEWQKKFEKYKKDIKAIGETGLDYFQFNLTKTTPLETLEELKEIQKMSLRRQIELAVENNLPMSIHARDTQGQNECVKDCLAIIAQEGKGLVRGSFHSYTGDIELLDDILDLGFYVGFNAIITYKSGENVREILSRVPLERILFETDGPFLPPQSVRKNKKLKEKFGQPGDVKEIIQVAAQIKNIPIEKLEEVTDENYLKLFH
jgi:TatD DNase family protein